MKKIFPIFFVVAICFLQIVAQIPTNTLVQIVKAEDERRYDATLENLLKNPDAKIRQRAALAAGRIGDEKAIPALIAQLNDDPATTAMILFALGEIESTKTAQTIIHFLKTNQQSDEIRARAIEAAGKIAAANPKDSQTAELGKAIVSALNNELGKRSAQNRETVLLGITAVLRARPEGGETIATKFLDDSDARIRADALNTLARLRSKSVNDKARELLARDLDPNVRANAARMLGIGEDKSAVELLLNAAMKDVDSRVRVSAIRSLGSLKDASVAETLINSPFKNSRSESLEIATTLGNLLLNTNNEKALGFLVEYDDFNNHESPEIKIAIAKIAPAKFFKIIRSVKNEKVPKTVKWQSTNALISGMSELSTTYDKNNPGNPNENPLVQISLNAWRQLIADEPEDKTLSDALTAYAAFKTDDLSQVLLEALKHKDPIVRATVAGLFSTQPPVNENIEALQSALIKALLIDKRENDAQLAILNALYKLNKKASVGTFLIALDAPDYLVRKKAFEILKDADLQKDFPGIRSSIESALAKKKNQVLPYAAYTGTKLGQILNTNADYIRAVSRKNGTVKAVFTTTKGNFTIDFTPEDAPLTVDNFIKLARSDYFNGVSVHRVVPNFVIQDGDPRGDGNGGPGWEIRCEINMLPFERGAIGMALSGKDTGGSQWFATHSPQSHLDGGYTVFGKVNETDMKVVDNIVRGDKILKVVIIEIDKLRTIPGRRSE